MTERFQHGHSASGGAAGFFLFQLSLQCFPFLRRKRFRVAGAVGQSEKHNDAQDDRGQAPENINPLPSVQAQHLGMMGDDSIEGFPR